MRKYIDFLCECEFLLSNELCRLRIFCLVFDSQFMFELVRLLGAQFVSLTEGAAAQSGKSVKAICLNILGSNERSDVASANHSLNEVAILACAQPRSNCWATRRYVVGSQWQTKRVTHSLVVICPSGTSTRVKWSWLTVAVRSNKSHSLIRKHSCLLATCRLTKDFNLGYPRTGLGRLSIGLQGYDC